MYPEDGDQYIKIIKAKDTVESWSGKMALGIDYIIESV
ncbi:Uncharacterised protein [Acinetobacter junii]|nr:hypothetical protein F948_02113 [Acinetobacter junii CIP 64.5]SSQ10863.1 Uncharacterised protein [Acinetobacter baumannii]SUU08433.1 Uncharacterised protein [Acinetobacter junii]SUU11147.1 Uncharacterised protein [Acinetobacter junii]